MNNISCKVLVVDDNEDVRKTVSGVLSDRGYIVKSASNETGAISILARESFDFIVLDIRLQGSADDDESGVNLAKSIRRRGIRSKIIFVTGRAVLAKHIKSVLEYGVVEYIEKNNANWIETIQRTIQNNFQRFDVFLCHNSEDKPKVRQIGEALIKRGLRPWLDEWQLQPGLPWQTTLETQIENIQAAAVFVGSSGIGPWQEPEVEHFLRTFVARNVPVIPVLLESAPTRAELPVFLRTMTWVDFRKKDPNPMRQLIWGITGKNSKMRGKKSVSTTQKEESPTTLPSKPARLLDVFCTTGLPDFTYVEPAIYRDVHSDILQPGKHVLIIGPSGSGKTCLLTRIFEDLNWKRDEDYLFVSALDENSNQKVEQILNETLTGTVNKPVILDDFHALDSQTRIHLGTKLKQLSDKAFDKMQAASTFILLGISVSPQALLYNAPDLGRRLGIYRMPSPRPSDLRTLIQKGEQKLTIEFSNPDKIIEDSSNSFFICQYLSSRICTEAQVHRTMDSLTILNYRIEDIRKHLMQQLSEQFRPFLISFAQKFGYEKEEWLPSLAIIASISSIPDFQFTLAEIASRCGDLGTILHTSKHKISRAISYGLDAKMGSFLYFEEGTELLSIEDPIFRYYLNHMDMEEFLQALGIPAKGQKKILEIFYTSKGKKTPEKEIQYKQTAREGIFISYSHKDREWLELLQTHLRPLLRNQQISLWVDTQIQAGMRWREEIDKAIASAKVAILMVSPDFLASDFIAENELPPLLKAAEQEGLKIIWIPISDCLYTEAEIADFQAAYTPSSPLDSLTNAERNRAFVNISKQIKYAFKISG